MSIFKTMNMSFNDITPRVRYVQFITLNPETPPVPKMLYDHRITYVYGGKGLIEIEDSPFTCKRGDLFYWGPAVTYAVHRDALDPLVLLNVHFDFTTNHDNKKFAPPAALLYNFNSENVTELVAFTDMKSFNTPFHLNNYYEGESLLLKITEEYRLQKIFYLQQINGMFLSFLASLALYLANEKNKSKGQHNTADDIIEYIHRNYHEPLTNKGIAKVFNFHPNYLNRLMLKHTGTSLHQYVLNVKVQKGAEMLHSSSDSISKIALDLGFSDISHFSKAFKERMGFNPNEAR